MPVISDKDPLSETKSKEQGLDAALTSVKLREFFHLNELKTVDPKRCKPWKYHNRDVAWLTKERCLDLIVSIHRNGQIEPAMVRRIAHDPDHDFEIICGVRRWFSCTQIPNQKFLACATDADDKTCMILMHAENADSKDRSR
jgi:ParB family chromosome partitioning protein